ncbi:MAG TPA: cysteine hydrolase [Acidimicrobiales bacterium]|nr:cysteine hydrolase [Acidimicrobiales bacterium]
MHRVAIPEEVLQRVATRGPRPQILDDLEPTRTAHLVVDLQHGYMEEGAPRECAMAREIVPQVNAISAAVRDAGGVNVFLRMNLDTAMTASWRTYLERLGDAAARERTIAAFTPGSPYFELWDGLDVAESDQVVDKTRFSPFVTGASALPELLQQRAVDTVIVSGTVTNVCCESTARDAMQLGYRVLFAADATATHSDAVHNATLANLLLSFADVQSAEEIVTALRRPSRVIAPAVAG